MARYYKANRKVAEYLHLEEVRTELRDGNFIFWQMDLQAFGPLTEIQSIMAQIGAIPLMSHEAREEQDGTVLRPLPEPEDERFKIVHATTATESTEETSTESAEETTDSESAEETSAESTEETSASETSDEQLNDE